MTEQPQDGRDCRKAGKRWHIQTSITIAVSVAGLVVFGVPQRSNAQVAASEVADAQATCPSWDAASNRIRASLMAGVKKTVQGWSSEPLDLTLICDGGRQYAVKQPQTAIVTSRKLNP